MAFDVRGSDSDELVPSAEINVTPFIDVMLVLLIIFMVTAPMLTQGMKVDLPKAAAAKSLDSKKAVTITIAADGALQVGDVAVSADGLVVAARAALADDQQPIRIRADKDTRYEDLMRVVDRLTGDGLTRVTFVTVPGK